MTASTRTETLRSMATTADAIATAVDRYRAALLAGAQRLSHSWRDAKFEAFSADLRAAMAPLGLFVADAHAMGSTLRADAEYLEQRR